MEKTKVCNVIDDVHCVSVSSLYELCKELLKGNITFIHSDNDNVNDDNLSCYVSSVMDKPSKGFTDNDVKLSLVKVISIIVHKRLNGKNGVICFPSNSYKIKSVDSDNNLYTECGRVKPLVLCDISLLEKLRLLLLHKF